MPDPATFRDSTQIVVPCDVIDDIQPELDQQFTVTVFSRGDTCRIIGSPVEIKAVNRFLTRRGITLL
jgi:hypothetical protein